MLQCIIKVPKTLKQLQHTFNVSFSCLDIGILKMTINSAGCFSSLYGCSMLLLLDVDSRYLLHHHLKVVKCVFLLLLLKWIHSFQSCLAAS